MMRNFWGGNYPLKFSSSVTNMVVLPIKVWADPNPNISCWSR